MFIWVAASCGMKNVNANVERIDTMLFKELNVERINTMLFKELKHIALW